MTDAPTSVMSSPIRIIVLGLVGLGLTIMFISSIYYRLSHPSRVVRVEQPKPSSQGEGMGMNEIGALMRKLETEPGNLDVQIELARRFLHMGAMDQARMFLEGAEKVAPKNPEVLSLKGFVLFREKRHQEAASVYEELLEFSPDDAGAHFNLGILYKHYLENPENGREHLQAALDAAPNDQQLRDMVEKELEDFLGE